jgi:hypothetical protein
MTRKSCSTRGRPTPSSPSLPNDSLSAGSKQSPTSSAAPPSGGMRSRAHGRPSRSTRCRTGPDPDRHPGAGRTPSGPMAGPGRIRCSIGSASGRPDRQLHLNRTLTYSVKPCSWRQPLALSMLVRAPKPSARSPMDRASDYGLERAMRCLTRTFAAQKRAKASDSDAETQRPS